MAVQNKNERKTYETQGGHDLAIRWQRGKGLEVTVDDKTVGVRATLGRMAVSL